MSQYKATRELLTTDLVIFNHGQATKTTPELPSPFLTSTPHQRKDVRAPQQIRRAMAPSTQRVFSRIRLELMTRRPRVRDLDQ
ncbi:hypothetical protein TNCV_1938381 [Trichonephila clavipes]|nr:hypothetical protein TNCV_1938381 [Trichonephila clavipes]